MELLRISLIGVPELRITIGLLATACRDLQDAQDNKPVPMQPWLQKRMNRDLGIPIVPLLLDAMYEAQENIENKAEHQKRLKSASSRYTTCKTNILEWLEDFIENADGSFMNATDAKTMKLARDWALCFQSFIQNLEPFSFEAPPISLTSPIEHLTSDKDPSDQDVETFIKVLTVADAFRI